MTASDILHIMTNVAVVQLICDILANWSIFRKEDYQRALSRLRSAKWKRDKATEDVKASTEKSEATATSGKKSSKADRDAKKLQRAEDDVKEAAGIVARTHTPPGIFVSILFMIVLRIFATEYQGKIVGILPFSTPTTPPFSILGRITSRGLDFEDVEFEDASGDGKVTDVSQACTYVFIYILSVMSIKFYVNQLFGTQPPPGADRGLFTVMESPGGQKILRSFGVDPDKFKEE